MENMTTTALLNVLPDPVLLIDAEKQILAANIAAKNLLGDQIEGRTLTLALRHPDILDAVDEVLNGAERRQIRISLLHSVRLSFDIQIASLTRTTQYEADTVLIMHDMTAERNAEKMRADFVANVSHELRSPLASLVGFIETLRGTARDDEAARDRFLKIMDDESKRMSRLIDDLLSLSRVEANEHILPEGKVDIGPLLAEIVDTFAIRASVRKITIELPENNAHVLAIGDRDELTEVFHNLIDNAVKYCPENTRVRINVEEVGRIPDLGGTGVVVTVSDDGNGIPPEHLPRLTERFYRVDKGRSRTMGGTGLGLAIVKHIVNRHRGRLTIDSTIEKGTECKVFLPSSPKVTNSEMLS